MRALAALSALLLLSACGEDDTQPFGDASNPGADVAASDRDAGTTDGPAPDGATPERTDGGAPTNPDGGPDPSDLLFDRSRLLRIELDLAPADWDALRAETRTVETTLARPQCLDEPFASPFHYYPARLRIDGTEYDPIGLRKKGFLGSLSDTKPSLKIKLDEYTNDVEHLGLSKLAFNNARQDPSIIKTCIGFDRMREAGVPAPRCGYAEVIVNGTSLGPYVHVEEVTRRFLRRRFGEADGHLYEGTVSDFRTGWTGTFEQELDEDMPYDRADIEAMRVALEADDSALKSSLAPLLDLDAYYRFWAAEVLIEHWDGYAGNTNNFYIYRRADGRFVFIPWGVDGILGSRTVPPFSVYAEGLMARRLYLFDDTRAEYLAALTAQVDRWDTDAILRDVDRAAATIAPAVPAAERPTVTITTQALRTWIRDRPAQLRAEIADGQSHWTNPLRDRLCYVISSVDATASTRFGTWPTSNPFGTGFGTFTATIGGTPARGLAVGSAAGFGTNPDDMDDVVLVIAASLANGSIQLLYVAVDPTLLVDGAVLPFDGIQVRGALLAIPRPNAPIELVAGIWTGVMAVTRGGSTPDAPIEVAIRAQLLAQRP